MLQTDMNDEKQHSNTASSIRILT